MTEIDERKWIELDLAGWRRVLEHRLHQPLTPPMLTDIWVKGLRAAGVKAHRAEVWVRGRKYPVKLAMVIEFDCPYSHRSVDRRTIASVRLLVEDDGWVSLDDDSLCPGCDQVAVERWLLTCPRCEAGVDSSGHPAGHQFHRGDASPLAAVLDLFSEQEKLVVLRWWVEHTDDASAWFEEWLASVLRGEQDYWESYESIMIDSAFAGTPEQYAEIVPEDMPRILPLMLPEARRMLGHATPPSQAVAPRAKWTDEAAADWLEQQTTDAGEPLISVVLSQRAAFALAQTRPGCPPKNSVERGQSLRKTRPAIAAEVTR